jgi:lon-related putative ATP-dependent protease
LARELSYEEATIRLPDGVITCTSAEMPPLAEIIGQEQAVRALRFGLKTRGRGFNVYVAGMPGTGRKTAISTFLEEMARGMPVPHDWCYVYNFRDPMRPKALRLPPGVGRELKGDMENFVSEARKALTTAFESQEYARRREEIVEAVQKESSELAEELDRLARREGFILQRSPIGFVMIPVMEGRPVSEQEFGLLPPALRKEIQSRREALEEKIRAFLSQLREAERKVDNAVRELNRRVAIFAMEPLLKPLMDKYASLEEVKEYLREVQSDILENLPIILGRGKEQQRLPIQMPEIIEDPTERYRVNLIVDNSALKGAPVVMELNPTYQNLFGKIEKEARFGILITDYTMIRGGSAHRANGGFLVVPVEDLLANPLSWEGLKRAMMNSSLEIEEIPERLGFWTAKSLRPEPIPFDAKVILIGSPWLYHLLYVLDKDFKELFKVKAEFDTTMERNEENIRKYASFICTLCRKEGLKHLDPSGIAAVIDYSSRLASDKRKLSTLFANVSDIIREANFYASEEGAEYISRRHVERALEERVYRSSLIQRKIEEMIARGIILIDTEGEAVGQVNGLSVVDLGDYSFGRPNRVTATVGLGREGVIDIEREARLGGPIHTKGVLILSGFLNERYARHKPLSLSARLVFEQSYSGVEGDSASSAELYAILSALSGVPIRQCLAVTGSVNQKGEVQAIGGVNEKIEGFYQVCKVKGLNGRQGVIIPESNVQNLVLRDEVVEAIRAGKFHIYPVRTIDEGIEILTGLRAGERRPDGTFEEGTINYLVQRRLEEMAEAIKEYPA